jgi:hypothetical protein
MLTLVIGLMQVQEVHELSFKIVKASFLQQVAAALPLPPTQQRMRPEKLPDGLLLAGQIGCIKIEVNSGCIEVIDGLHGSH